MNAQSKTFQYPLVSIIIPTYNCLDYLKLAIASIRKQDYPNLEVIVIDDKSNDGTSDWLNTQKKTDPWIKPYCINGDGVSQVRNYGIDRAQGDYIAFLDADDLWLPGKLHKQINFHEANPDILLSFTNYEHYDMQGISLGNCFAFWPHFSRISDKTNKEFVRIDRLPTAAIFAENVIGTSTVMVKKSALQNANGFDTNLKSASDWELWLRISKQGPIGYTSETLMDYLVREGSISRKTELRLQQMQEIIRRYGNQLRFSAPLAVIRAHARLLVGWAEHYNAEGKHSKAFFSHLKALLLSPSTRLAKATIADAFYLSGLKR